ncbi:DtxR family transcriptional regulator [Desulfocarbo indianensis]|nr:DtxR family transcriptional regulator [Desulfocarbo indianensis]
MSIVSSPLTRDPEDLTSHLEDYLEVIAALQQEDHVARAKDIADRLSVARGTVTSALKSLSEKGLINYQPYSHITLTKAGEELAQRIIHRHKTLTTYLNQVLRISREKAEQNACRAEHVLDEEVIERMVQFLEFMHKCPRTNKVWIDSFDKFCWGGQDKGNCKECIGQCLANLYDK